MKNIQINTLHFYNNFGSVLQAYALKHTLEVYFDAQVCISDFCPPVPEWRYFSDSVLQEKYEEKKRKFEDFRERYLGLDIRYDINEQVYDAYIVGSDIVWGKEFSLLDSHYFLTHAPVGTRKIAYAASTILDRDGHTEDDAVFERYLPEFDAIAVRETSAIKSIERLSGKCVEAVLDPTLLLNQTDYESLIIENGDMKEQPYLLSYFLTHDPAVVDYTNMMAKKFALRVIHYFADYPDRVFDPDARCFAFVGPGEFLGYIKNASLIFTNSFHGTCFSVIYRKPFYTYTAKRAMLSRVRDTIERLGLEDRYFTDFRDLNKVTLEIDYGACETNLSKEREKSLDFLRRALGGNL